MLSQRRAREGPLSCVDGLERGARRDDIVTLAKNSIEASFLPNDQKQAHLARISELAG